MQSDLKLIKKYYGENMMHLCHELFPTILEEEGLLFSILSSNIAYTKSLYDDIRTTEQIEEFQNYIYSFCKGKYKRHLKSTDKTPFQLMDEAGYTLYECKTEDDVSKFKKYYLEDEELCTFNNIKRRLEQNYVFWAIKKDVDNIERSHFNPKRQDEYGTSVISIQFSKGVKNTLSIKNRYNHTVQNPDATFSNDLENIISGLTYSFENYYGLNINQAYIYSDLDLSDDYVLAEDSRFYRINVEIGNIYYCENNIIIDGDKIVDTFADKSRYIVMDYFILALTKENGHFYGMKLYDESINDCFCNIHKNIKNISIKKNGNDKILTIEKNNEKIYITLDKHNSIVGYKNDNINYIANNFLYYNYTLRHLELPNVLTIGDNFLNYNQELKTISFSNLTSSGKNFMKFNEGLQFFKALKLKIVDDGFLCSNKQLKIFDAPNIHRFGNYCLMDNEKLEILIQPYLESVGNKFLCYNETLIFFYAPNLRAVFKDTLCCNNVIHDFIAPNLKYIEMGFLENNRWYWEHKINRPFDIKVLEIMGYIKPSEEKEKIKTK